jgi:hypothetical protein
MKEHLLELLHKEPFESFTIVLASGEGFEVSNRDLVALGESLIHIFFPKSDRYATLRLNQITSVEAGKGNGRRGGKKR